MVAAPLLVESKVFGVLIAARQQAHSFSSGECEFLRQASEHVALAAHQAQLYSALQQAYDDLRQTQKAVMQQERSAGPGPNGERHRARYQQCHFSRVASTPNRYWRGSRDLSPSAREPARNHPARH